MAKKLKGNFEWAIGNVEAFQRGLDRLGAATSDFRIPFRLITSDFYRSQKQLVNLKSKGMYEDLSTKPFTAWWEKEKSLNRRYEGGYKEYKEARLGFAYPILLGATGDLFESTLKKTHRYSIFFLNKQELNIGTSVPYGKFHQSDAPRKKIPQRKFVFIDGGKGDKSKGSGINGRRGRWLNIMNDHVTQLITGEVLR